MHMVLEWLEWVKDGKLGKHNLFKVPLHGSVAMFDGWRSTPLMVKYIVG